MDPFYGTTFGSLLLNSPCRLKNYCQVVSIIGGMYYPPLVHANICPWWRNLNAAILCLGLLLSVRLMTNNFITAPKATIAFYLYGWFMMASDLDFKRKIISILTWFQVICQLYWIYSLPFIVGIMYATSPTRIWLKPMIAARGGCFRRYVYKYYTETWDRADMYGIIEWRKRWHLCFLGLTGREESPGIYRFDWQALEVYPTRSPGPSTRNNYKPQAALGSSTKIRGRKEPSFDEEMKRGGRI